MYIMLDSMCVTMSISTGLYPNLDLWTTNKLQLHNMHTGPGFISLTGTTEPSLSLTISMETAPPFPL
jgi:hypothetical protein